MQLRLFAGLGFGFEGLTSCLFCCRAQWYCCAVPLLLLEAAADKLDFFVCGLLTWAGMVYAVLSGGPDVCRFSMLQLQLIRAAAQHLEGVACTCSKSAPLGPPRDLQGVFLGRSS